MVWMKQRDRDCLTKRRFPTESAALAAAAEIAVNKARLGKPYWTLRAYRCRHCKQWHLTKRSPQGRV